MNIHYAFCFCFLCALCFLRAPVATAIPHSCTHHSNPSANFTNRGQTRNIEAGALLHDPGFAKALVTQFQSLIDGNYIRGYDDDTKSPA